MRRLIAVLLLTVTGLAFITSCIKAPAPDATGTEIYAQLCANCHSADLSGGLGPALGPGSNAAEQDDAFLELTITRGRGRMPSFDGKLSDEQLQRLIAYIRSEQK